MSVAPNSHSKAPSICAGISGIVLFVLGLSSCRNVQTESRWLGLVSERVDKGPDWFSILLLVVGGASVSYFIARAAVSKGSRQSSVEAVQTEQPQSLSTPSSDADRIVTWMRMFAIGGLYLVRSSDSGGWKVCGGVIAGLSSLGLVIHHWKHEQHGKRDVVVIALSVIAILAGFVWALS